MKTCFLNVSCMLALCLAALGCAPTEDSRVVDRPDTDKTNSFYVSNRPPLAPSPFVKLPIGAIKAQGWLRRQLELEADGFTGHLTEISKFLRKEDNAWLSPDGQGHSGWEEVPYWLKGFGDLGYVLGNQRIINESRLWIEAILASQEPDGWFGPRSNKTKRKGRPDLWPNMIALNILQSYYEHTSDRRVLDLMSKYFRWQMTVPEEDFLPDSWAKRRAGDNLASVYWLYNHTGEKWLLSLAEKVHRHTMDWTGGVASWHNVNIAQCFRETAVFYQQSKNDIHLQAAERNYRTVMAAYGQVPGGMFGGDENCREGYVGPRQAIETCGIVEMMLSDEMLLKITGDPKYADRCEDVAFNSFPASMTADLKALHYLTAPNMILCDAANKSPGLQNGGAMLIFDPHRYRCCQHNVAHGWPYYAEHLWLATADNGLAAVLYAPCTVTAKVGAGTEVTIDQKTRYPFDRNIELTITTAKRVKFPLYLRVPGWCDNLTVNINGKPLNIQARPRSYIVLNRIWSNADTVDIALPMKITLRTWTSNKKSVSVDRGPLTYSLKIGEKYVRNGGTDKWPAWEIHPTTDWNYGLVLNEIEPASSFQLLRKPWPDDDQPFTPDAAPVHLRAEARKIPQWKKDHLGLVGPIQQSPVKSDESVETVTLIPMGCARLRVSAFPTIGTGPDAHEWSQTAQPQEEK